LGLLAYIGLGLFAFRAAFPEVLPDVLRADEVFPYYIVHALPAGVSGLVITGVFAAAMSSVDSGINSLSTVVVSDFVRPRSRGRFTETGGVRLARILTFAFGFFATLAAFYASTFEQVVKAPQVFLGLFSGPILALFLLGILTRRGTFPGWAIGATCAIGLTVWVQNWTSVHFIYYFPLNFFVSFALGYAASLFFRPGPVDPELVLRRGRP